MKELLTKLQLQQKFSDKELEHVFTAIINREFSQPEIAAFLFGLSVRGETSAELLSLVSLLKLRARSFGYSADAIDVCGTGGDLHNSLNISTAVAFVLAACSVKVIKHGNRAVSSKSGSSDVLQELAIDINADHKKMLECFNLHNFCFLYAPYYHPAIKEVAEIRQILKVRTIFNQIGPLLNPANLKKQLIGVYNKELMDKYAEILLKLNYEHAFIVSSEDGLDEISIAAKTHIIEIFAGKRQQYVFDPVSILNKTHKLVDIAGKDAKYNANAMLDLFSGKENAYHDAVCLNAAFALRLNKPDASIEDCFSTIKDKLLNGDVYKKYLEIKNFFAK